MTVTIGRRELLAALGGAAGAWPLVVCAYTIAVPILQDGRRRDGGARSSGRTEL